MLETCCNDDAEPPPSCKSRSSQQASPQFHSRNNAQFPQESVGPAANRIPLLFRDRHGPVGKGECRALFEKPGIVLSPALVAFQGPVDADVGPAGEPLQVLDRELFLPGLLDSIEQVRLFLGHLRFLPARHTVEEREEIFCRYKISLTRIHAERPVFGSLLVALLVVKRRVALDQVVEHIGVSPVVDRVKPDSLREWNDHPHHLLVHDLPDGPTGNEFGRFIDDRVRVLLLLLLLGRKHLCVLLRGFINPAGQHPVHYLIITGPFLLCNPPRHTAREWSRPGGSGPWLRSYG